MGLNSNFMRCVICEFAFLIHHQKRSITSFIVLGTIWTLAHLKGNQRDCSLMVDDEHFKGLTRHQMWFINRESLSNHSFAFLPSLIDLCEKSSGQINPFPWVAVEIIQKTFA